MNEYETRIVDLMKKSRTDELTGLGNYRAFREYLSMLRELGVGFSVLLFDMTNLKRANEDLGHFGADVVLRNVAELVREDQDAVFRHGGDEFAVVLPCCPMGGAVQVMERIEQRVGKSMLPSGHVLRLVGAACQVTPDVDLLGEMNRADRRLERRKAQLKAVEA